MIFQVDFKSVEAPPYMRGQRIPTVVVRVVSPSSPCARPFLLMTHEYRGSIVVLSISKSVEPNEEQKEMTSGFQ